MLFSLSLMQQEPISRSLRASVSILGNHSFQALGRRLPRTKSSGDSRPALRRARLRVSNTPEERYQLALYVHVA